jgi:hypothetical protein
MITMSEDHAAQSDERLLLDNPRTDAHSHGDGRRGPDPWEAGVLPRVVEEVCFMSAQALGLGWNQEECRGRAWTDVPAEYGSKLLAAWSSQLSRH